MSKPDLPDDAPAHLWRDSFASAPVGLAHTATDGTVLRANPHACELLGYTEAQLRGMNFVDLTHPEDLAPNAVLFQRLLAGEISRYELDERFIRRDGRCLWTHLAVSLRRAADGQPEYLIVCVQEIEERKRRELDLVASCARLDAELAGQQARLQETQQLLQSQIKRALDLGDQQRRGEQRLLTIADNLPAMIGYWNAQLRCEFANRRYKEWFGLEPEQIIGMHMRALMGEELFARNEPYARLALAGQPQQFERTLTKADGTVACTAARYVPDLAPGGEVRGFFVLVTDITALRAITAALEGANARLREDSSTDYLTGLANRRVFTQRSEEAAQQFHAGGAPYGLILIDIDDFKVINDTHGHDVGDEVLSIFGRTLRGQVRRPQDLVARLGGEEFGILCLEIDETALRQVAERLRQEVAATTADTRSGPVRLSCSCGVALSLPQDLDFKRIYTRADKALYEAKSCGKDRVVYRRSDTPETTGRFRGLRS